MQPWKQRKQESSFDEVIGLFHYRNRVTLLAMGKFTGTNLHFVPRKDKVGSHRVPMKQDQYSTDCVTLHTVLIAAQSAVKYILCCTHLQMGTGWNRRMKNASKSAMSYLEAIEASWRRLMHR